MSVREVLDGGGLRRGSVVEFEKEHGRVLIGLVVRPEGKKNWIVQDQQGSTFSVRPNQITFAVTGGPDWVVANLRSFLDDVEELCVSVHASV